MLGSTFSAMHGTTFNSDDSFKTDAKESPEFDFELTSFLT